MGKVAEAEEKTEDFVTTVSEYLVYYVIYIIYAVLNGWALQLGWRWFVISTFQVPEIPMVSAMMIVILIRWVTGLADYYGRQDDLELGVMKDTGESMIRMRAELLGRRIGGTAAFLLLIAAVKFLVGR